MNLFGFFNKSPSAQKVISRETFLALKERTKFLSRLPQGKVKLPASLNQLNLERQGNQLMLSFKGNNTEIMSRLHVHDPLELVSPYTQAMMLSLLWKDKPNRVYVIGLGGGRIPMVLHSYFPELTIDCTEMREDVVEAAQHYFAVSVDERLAVIIEDGRTYLEKKLEQSAYDAIFVDAFTGTGTSPMPLSTIEFYSLCRQHLTEGGICVINLLVRDPLYQDKVATIQSSFENVYKVEMPSGWGGAIFLATDSAVISKIELINSSQKIANSYGFSFPLVEHAKRMELLDTLSGKVLRD